MKAHLRHANLNFILQALLDVLQLVFQRCKISQLLERILNLKTQPDYMLGSCLISTLQYILFTCCLSGLNQ